jgi:hypothetical protein
VLATALALALFAAEGSASAQAPPAPPAAAAPTPAQPPAPSGPEAAPTAASDVDKRLSEQRADIDEQDARIVELEHQLKQLKAEKTAPATAPAAPLPAKSAESTAEAPNGESPLKLSAYIQSQYEIHQDSEDQLLPGGKPINQNRFLIRRLRFKVERQWRYGGALFELDANSVNGPSIGMQHAEVSFAYRNDDQTPMIGVTGGLFDVPFGRELVESPRERPFMERSLASRSFFPAEPDLGVRIAGQVAWFRYALAVINGQPLGDRTGFILQDPNVHKDFVGRVGVDVAIPDSMRVTGGVSVLNGLGFHPGSDPTKNTVVWQDTNGNGNIDIGELAPVGGSAGLPSVNFKRWLVGADLGYELTSSIGRTSLFGELSVGSDMDRGLFIADPVTLGHTERELGYYVALYQEFGHGSRGGYDLGSVTLGPIAGVRYDLYNPNSDFLESTAGKIVPRTQTIRTISPLVGLQVPHRARFIVEYDIVHDELARNTVGVPTDRKNNVWTFRFQGEL